MTPSLALAHKLAGAVLDQVEHDGALHDNRIAEAILARMCVLGFREQEEEALRPSMVLVEDAKRLINQLQSAVVNGNCCWPVELLTAGVELEKTLRREGFL